MCSLAIETGAVKETEERGARCHPSRSKLMEWAHSQEVRPAGLARELQVLRSGRTTGLLRVGSAGLRA